MRSGLFAVVAVAGLAASSCLMQARATEVPVRLLAAPIQLDGHTADWNDDLGHVRVVMPSSMAGEVVEGGLGDWDPEVQVAAGVFEDTFYLVVHWRDEQADTIYKPWKKNGTRYSHSRRQDDMMAVRFQLGDSFNACMLSGTDYRTDVWHWTAGRSAMAGIADDMTHTLSPNFIDNAAVYETPEGTVYIKKTRDDGDGGWIYTARPKGGDQDLLPAVAIDGVPSGSRGDVKAVGSWSNGTWTVELSRKMKVDDPNDVVFVPGSIQIGQIAVFNAGYKVQKRITPPLKFQFRGAQ